MSPGSASCSRRAATLTASLRIGVSWSGPSAASTSPVLTPILTWSRTDHSRSRSSLKRSNVTWSRASILLEQLACRLVVAPEHLPERLRVQPLTESSGVDEISEDHRHRLATAPGCDGQGQGLTAVRAVARPFVNRLTAMRADRHRSPERCCQRVSPVCRALHQARDLV